MCLSNAICTGYPPFVHNLVNDHEVRLCTSWLKSVDPSLESARFQPLNLSSEKPLSEFAFKFNLCRYHESHKKLRKMVKHKNKHQKDMTRTWWGSAG
jgi:hypothetical protein